MTGVLLMVVAVGAMVVTRRTSVWVIEVAAWRVAAMAWIGAGVAGVHGWVGAVMQTVVSWAMGACDALGSTAFGAAAGWVLALSLSSVWVLAMLPDPVCDVQRPSWLIVSGALLPALLLAVPGGLGVVLRAVVYPVGTAAAYLAGAAVS